MVHEIYICMHVKRGWGRLALITRLDDDDDKGMIHVESGLEWT